MGNKVKYNLKNVHAAHLGLPIPEKLKAVLEQLHDRAEKGGDE